MIKTVLVTGGGGFIGSHILELLLENKFEVIILERTPESTARIKHLLPRVKIYYSSSTNLADIFADNRIDCVIHLAALYIKEHESVADVENIINANVKFTATLAEFCSEHRVKYFINAGSLFEYGICNDNIVEGHEKAPLNLYATSKVASEEFLKYYCRDKGLNVANFILFAPFGDGDNEKLFAFLVKSLMNDDEIDFSGGEQKWNFTYVKDIALAFICAISNFAKIKGYEDFNVGYDKVYSLKEIVNKLEQIAGKKLKVNYGAKPYVRNEYFYFNCDNSKIKKILGWRPKYDFDYGLKIAYDYYSNYYSKEKK